MPSGKKVVLITGASSGIGLALLQQLLQTPQKYRLVASARQQSLARFNEMGISESDDLRILPLDLTKPEECDAVIEEIEASWGGVDILINNAGISFRSVVEHFVEEDVHLQFETNVFAPMHLARLCLPSMRQKRSGRIINVSSVGGMMAMPTMGLYSASKFALEGFSEALYYEMRPWNVSVTLLQPGFVRSDSFKNVYLSKAAREAIETKGRYANYYYHMSRFIAKLMNSARATPESIAKKIIRVMEQKHPPLRAPASFDAKFFSVFSRIIPRRLYHWLLYKKLPGIKTWGTRIVPGENEA
ncbi:MAG: SDR family oxidoreductase [Opitutaceae bacterium]